MPEDERPPAAGDLTGWVPGAGPGLADALDALLSRQNYRLAYWRTAGRELGYRRFFDVNDLVGLRMENRQCHPHGGPQAARP